MRPRVTIAGGSVPRLLEEEVAELLAQDAPLSVRLVGPGGSGRTTALRHLAAVFAADPRLGLVDLDGTGRDGERVRIRAADLGDGSGLTLAMAPWSDDDALEYLMRAHPSRTAAAFAIWQRERPDLGRWPGLCRALLDHFAALRAQDLAAALHLVIEQVLPGDLRPLAGGVALRHCTADDSFATRAPDVPFVREAAPAVRALLAVPLVRAQLAAEVMLQLVEDSRAMPLAGLHWSPLLLEAVRREVIADAARQARLIERSGDDAMTASCLSLLCTAQPGFRPPVTELGDLRHARLAGADLHRLRLRQLDHANLDGADLREADLREATATGARLDRARLDGAAAEDLQAAGLQSRHLQARNARLQRANLRMADLSHAVLDGARLHEAVLAHCLLDGASLRGATLDRAHLLHASLANIDLRQAHCHHAVLAELDLRTAQLDGIDLDFANLDGADLSDTAIPRLQARAVRFCRTTLTGARWPGAQLHSSRFYAARLAGVDWEGADLRAANFRGATFQFGGSRSGLIDSTIASEGSRTGFYTDESLEAHFQAPEDVRKANLRCCDLRGATLQGCDFYLVDLRGARLDEAQLDWLRRCRAILDRDPIVG